MVSRSRLDVHRRMAGARRQRVCAVLVMRERSAFCRVTRRTLSITHKELSMTRTHTLAFVGLLAIASACSNTAKGVEQDAEKVGDQAAAATDKAADATSGAAQDAKATMGAAMETVDVKAALLADTRVKATGINVDTNKEARTVTLNGTVPSESDRTLAVEIATAKAPDYRIVNNLTISK
jgi:osmotically-inducible protein OsmY